MISPIAWPRKWPRPWAAMSRKLTLRQAIATSFPTWDDAMADRLIAWLDHCGYQIVEKPHAEASLVPSASDDEVVPERAD
jgi:hypothetical protein